MVSERRNCGVGACESDGRGAIIQALWDFFGLWSGIGYRERNKG